jgi:ferritin-like metal-binding protein YciE
MTQAARELLQHGLKDIYDAEHRFVTALVEMESNATDETLADGFRRHKDMTQGQIERLETAFDDIGIEPEREACAGAQGLIKEYKSFVSDKSYGSGMLDAFAAGAALKVEHYEIATYRALIDLAEFCDFDTAARALKQNLAEEEATAAELQSAATTLGANLADASTADVAGRAVGSAIDHVREATAANIGGARAVGQRAVKGARKAIKAAETRGRTARKKTSSSRKTTSRPTAKKSSARTPARKKKAAPKSRSRSRSKSR